MTATSEAPKALPTSYVVMRSTSWWGVWTLIVTEGSLFGYLLLSYYYLALQNPEHWPPEGLPDVTLPGINTVLLLSSSVFVWLSERCIRRNRINWSLLPMAVAILLGALFVGIQLKEYAGKAYGITSNLYGSLYFTITGFHMAHVVIGLITLSTLMLWEKMGYMNSKRYGPLALGGLYWHFVDIVWLFIFSTFYIVPYVVGR